MYFFSNSWGVPGVSEGSVWLSGGQFGLKSLLTRIHDVFFSRPDPRLDQSRPAWVQKWPRNVDVLGISWIFCHYLKIFVIFFECLSFSLEVLAHSWTQPGRNWSDLASGRFKKTSCMRIDKLFKPNWPPRHPDRPRDPQTGLPSSFGIYCN